MTKLNERLPAKSDDPQSDTELFAQRVLRGMRQAVREAIAEHHRAGNPVVIWREGRIVLWYPDGTYRPVEEEAPGDSPPLTADAGRD